MSPQLTTTENTITYHNFQFILGPFRPRETKDNAYGKFWGDKQRTLWYVMVFSVVVHCFSKCIS